MTSTPLVSGLGFPEGPRWHGGRLWFSDISAGTVLSVATDGTVRVEARDLQLPSGLGWLPDGRLLVVEGATRRLLRQERDGSLEVHADLSRLVPAPCNDMLVDPAGRAYVGNWGFDFIAREKPAATVLVCVTPDGDARIVADDLMFPNGCVLAEDGRTLLVAETYAGRVTAFAVRPDGTLGDRRVWAAFAELRPDGICLDGAGALWIASPPTQEVVRVLPGGEMTHRVPTEADALACALGGEDGRTLFILSSALIDRSQPRAAFHGFAAHERLKAGTIRTVAVEGPGLAA